MKAAQDYYKEGDQVAFGFNVAKKKLASYNVNTYLDDPKKDVVTLTNQFASLPTVRTTFSRRFSKRRRKKFK
jgi:hypothetical protein